LRSLKISAEKQRKIAIFGVLCGVAYLAWRGFEKSIETEAQVVNENMLKYYGAKSESEIKDAITEIAGNYSYGANFTDLYNFLFEIVCAETNFGNAKDTTLESGEGLTQFDKTTFTELYNLAQAEKKLPSEFYNLTYYDLRKNPRFSIWMARYFVYKRIPHKIPSTIDGRASDWKKYYNTIYGAGTVEHYKSMVSKWEHLR
jgi:hypothetical protein